MRSRAVRLTLTLLAVVALAAAAYLSWNIDQRLAATAISRRATEARLTAASRQTYELRAAQQAYVADGQSETFWIAKVAEWVPALEETLGALRSSPVSASTRAALDRATESLDEFARFDRRARDYASTGQKLLASDLIFSDGLEHTQQILTALDEARAAEVAALSALDRKSRRELATTVAAGVGVALFAIFLLAPAGRRPEESDAAAVATPTGPSVLDIRDLDLVKKPVKAAASPPPGPPAPVAAAHGIQDVAEVCTQLARVSDTASLPAILQRTALALDAAGVVLWITEPDGSELVPVASHGYGPTALSRMGPIARDAENVTAAAFRTGLLQTVTGGTTSNGAIAAPLVNPSGCVGVLSAEVRHDGEKVPARLALATIVAAQLAALTAPAARTENRAAL